MVSTFSSGKNTIQALSHSVVCRETSKNTFKNTSPRYHTASFGSWQDLPKHVVGLFFFFNVMQCTNWNILGINVPILKPQFCYLSDTLNAIFLIQAPFPQKLELGWIASHLFDLCYKLTLLGTKVKSKVLIVRTIRGTVIMIKYSQIPPVNDQKDFPTYSCVRTKDTRAIPPFTIPTKKREIANMS